MVSLGSGNGSRGPVLPMLLVGNGIVGGMEEYVLSLLRRFRDRGRRALVGAPFVGEFTAALLDGGFPAVDLHILDMSDQIHVNALAQLTTLIRARGVDLLHTNLQPADTLGAAAAAHAGVPCVSTLHGLHRCREELLLRDLYGLEFLAVSEAGRVSAIENGVAAEAVRVLFNGVDPERFDPARFDREAKRTELGLGPNDVLVTCVSRLAREKAPELFLRAAHVAAAAEPRLVFALVGTGPLESKLRQMTWVSPAGDRLRLLGARRDIPEILAASDVAALSSRTESLPFSVLEAMAMRLPVVAHDVGGVGEALRDGEDGYLVPFGRVRRFADRVVELARDDELRARLGESARRRVLERFDFRRTADELLELYAATVARGRVAPPAIGLPLRASAGGLSVLERGARNGHAAVLGLAGRLPLSPRGGGRRPRAAPARNRAAAASRPGGAKAPRDADRHPDDTDQPQHRQPIVDSHLHLSGRESAAQVLDTLDEAGVDRACLIGPFLHPETWIPASGRELGWANAYLLKLAAAAPERLWPLVTVDPRETEAPRRVEAYAQNPIVRGVKLIPHGWRPDEACATAVYEACETAGLPILFHSGVFISGRASDACRPAAYEAVRRFPELRIVLAHLGWPWVDEAIAVAFMDPLRGREPQILLDLSPGTPPIYRPEALHRALSVVGSHTLLFGSDRFFPVDAAAIREQLDADVRALRACGAGVEDVRRIVHDNAAALFGRGVGGRRTRSGVVSIAAAGAGNGAGPAGTTRLEEEVS